MAARQDHLPISPLPITIHLAALGGWSSLPEIQTPFQLSYESVSPAWREDLIDQGWESGVFTKSMLKHLRAQPGVIFAELSFQPYIDMDRQPLFPSVQLRWARAAAKLLKQLSIEGADALYFDGSLKVFTPEMIEEVNPKDPVSLFHLFVEIWGDQTQVSTEGMSIFGLPEVVVTGLEPQSPEAQATAFSASAQMVCDGLRLPSETHFRSSESFPWFVSEWVNDARQTATHSSETSTEPMLTHAQVDPENGTTEVHQEVEDQSVDATCGICHLIPVSDEIGERLSLDWLAQQRDDM